VVEEGVASLEVLARALIARVVAEGKGRLEDRLLLGLEGLELDVTHEPALVGAGAEVRRALYRGHAADHGLRLHVLEQRLARGLAERLGRVSDLRLVAAVVGPLVAGRVGLGVLPRRPERERVVGDVVVEIDEAGVDRPGRLDAAGSVEAFRRWIAHRLDGVDQLVGADVERAVLDHGSLLVHRDEAAVDHERGGHRLAGGLWGVPDQRVTVVGRGALN